MVDRIFVGELKFVGSMIISIHYVIFIHQLAVHYGI